MRRPDIYIFLVVQLPHMTQRPHFIANYIFCYLHRGIRIFGLPGSTPGARRSSVLTGAAFGSQGS